MLCEKLFDSFVVSIHAIWILRPTWHSLACMFQGKACARSSTVLREPSTVSHGPTRASGRSLGIASRRVSREGALQERVPARLRALRAPKTVGGPYRTRLKYVPRSRTGHRLLSKH